MEKFQGSIQEGNAAKVLFTSADKTGVTLLSSFVNVDSPIDVVIRINNEIICSRTFDKVARGFDWSAFFPFEVDEENPLVLSDQDQLIVDLSRDLVAEEFVDFYGQYMSIINSDTPIVMGVEFATLAETLNGNETNKVVSPNTLRDSQNQRLPNYLGRIFFPLGTVIYDIGETPVVHYSRGVHWLNLNMEFSSIGPVGSGADVESNTLFDLYTYLHQYDPSVVIDGSTLDPQEDWDMRRPLISSLFDTRGRTLVGVQPGKEQGERVGTWDTSIGISNMPSHNHGGGEHVHAISSLTRIMPDDSPGVNGFPVGGGSGDPAGEFVHLAFGLTIGSSGQLIQSEGSGTPFSIAQPTLFAFKSILLSLGV